MKLRPGWRYAFFVINRDVILSFHKKLGFPAKIPLKNEDHFHTYALEIPTKEDRKKILDFEDLPNFQDFQYFEIENFIQQGKLKGFDFKYIGISNDRLEKVILDSEGRVVYGTKNKPYKLYHPEKNEYTWNDYFPNGEILPFVCYHKNGEVIGKALENIIDKLPENCSEESMILVFQWKNENPSKDGYFVTPKVVSVKKLSNLLK